MKSKRGSARSPMADTRRRVLRAAGSIGLSAFTLVALMTIAGCGGGTLPGIRMQQVPLSSIQMAVFPAATTVVRGGNQSFTATVSNTGDTTVTWSVKEGITGGTITSTGVYTAPQGFGTFHVVASSRADPSVTDTAIIVVVGGTFSATGSMSSSRAGHSSTLLMDGRVLIAGGFEQSSLISPPTVPAVTAEIYDPVTGRFTKTGVMNAARSGHTATLLPNGKVLIVGGDSSSSAELYDPANGLFTPAGHTNAAPGQAVLLGNGKVLLAGNVRAEIYDPATGAFTPAGPYTSPHRFLVSATLLTDGRVLIDDGGYSGARRTEIYDPAANAFSLAPDLVPGSMELDAYALTSLRNGKVLVIGGTDELERYASGTLYDPIAGPAPTGVLAFGRAWHTSTLLSDGTVLVAGGEGWSCPVDYWSSSNRFGYCEFMGSLAQSEVYDPTTGTFVRTGNMLVGRSEHRATLLKDGRVLVTGGISYRGIGVFDGSLASAEIYTPAP